MYGSESSVTAGGSDTVTVTALMRSTIRFTADALAESACLVPRRESVFDVAERTFERGVVLHEDARHSVVVNPVQANF